MLASSDPATKHSLLITLMSLAVHLPSLSGDFVFDDLPAIRENADVTGSGRLESILSHDFWGEPMASRHSHKSYRPLTTLMFRTLFHVSSGSPVAFHAVNIALHVCNSLMVYAVAKKVIDLSREDALGTALMFSVHPVHVESVAACVGLADLAYTCLVLISLLMMAPREHRVILFLATLAPFVKEQGIMIWPLFVALQVFRGKILPVKKMCLAAVHVAALTFTRLWIMNFEQPSFQEQDNPAAFLSSRWQRMLNHGYHYFLNFWLLLNPDWLCFDWAMGCLETISDISDFRNILSIAFTCTLLGVVKNIDKRQLSGLALLILPFIPAANIFFDVGFVIAERNLYLSAFGFAVLVHLGLRKLRNFCRTKAQIFKIMHLLTLVSLSAKSFHRCSQWQTEDSLFRSGLRVCPKNAKVHYNIAKRIGDSGMDDDLAIREYQIAIDLSPKYEQAFNNLGNLLRKKGDLVGAEESLLMAVDFNPSVASAWMNLGIVQASLKKFDMAEQSYSNALKLRRPYPDCNFNMGNLYLKTGDSERALIYFSAAIQEDPRHQLAYSNLIILADELEKWQLAEKRARQAIELFPHVAEFHFHLANILGKRGDFQNAEGEYGVAIGLRKSALYYGNLGVLYHRWGKLDKAIESYRAALALDPGNVNARNNLNRLQQPVRQ